MNYEKFYYIAEIIGTVAFASSGTLVAIRKGMDVFGIVVLAIITAIGGGVIRDITLGITPPMAFRDNTYTVVAIITALVLILFLSKKIKFLRLNTVNRNFMIKYTQVASVLDAIGLGLFTVSGVSVAMVRGYSNNAFLMIFVGVITGCGGGVLRDLLSDTIQIIFTKNTIYAVASLLGAVVFIVLRPYGANFSFLMGALTTVVIRLLSMKYRWSLPDVSSDLVDGDDA